VSLSKHYFVNSDEASERRVVKISAMAVVSCHVVFFERPPSRLLENVRMATRDIAWNGYRLPIPRQARSDRVTVYIRCMPVVFADVPWDCLQPGSGK